MIKFVSFYKKVGEESKSKKITRRLNLRNFTYEKCLELLYKTFNKFNPNHAFIIATDQKTEIPKLPVTVVRDNLSNLLIMEAITRSNTNFILNNSGKIVLAGADHLICGSIENLFDEDFDLGFWIFPDYDPSHRISVSMTIVLVNKNENNSVEIDNFFKERDKISFGLDRKERQWFADQKSISMLLETKGLITEYHKNKDIKNIFNFGNLKVKFFPYYEKKYLSDVHDDGYFEINPETVLIDFPGHSSKEFIDIVYQKILEEKN